MAIPSPEGRGWQTLVENRIKEAHERGSFRHLAGTGKPIPDIDEPYDPMWWIKKFLKREQVQVASPAAQLRQEIVQMFQALGQIPDEQAVRRAVAHLNTEILKLNRAAGSDAASIPPPLSADKVVAQWKADRR